MDIFTDEQKVITAKRLKELRQSKKLSHQSLSEELKKNNVEISVQALKDYEVTEEYHSKFKSTKGMSIERLYGLASFYNVSVDYLLGKSDTKSPNVTVQQMHQYTGLSEKAINLLHFIRNGSFSSMASGVIHFEAENSRFAPANIYSTFIESYDFLNLTTLIGRYNKLSAEAKSFENRKSKANGRYSEWIMQARECANKLEHKHALAMGGLQVANVSDIADTLLWKISRSFEDIVKKLIDNELSEIDIDNITEE